MLRASHRRRRRSPSAALGARLRRGRSRASARLSDFSFESPVGVYDMAAVQRGFQVYSQVCADLPLDGSPRVSPSRRRGRAVRGLSACATTRPARANCMSASREHGGASSTSPTIRTCARSPQGVMITDIDPNSGQLDRSSGPHLGSFPPSVPERDRRARRQWRRLSARSLRDHARAPRRRRLHPLAADGLHRRIARHAAYVNPYFPGRPASRCRRRSWTAR